MYNISDKFLNNLFLEFISERYVDYIGVVKFSGASEDFFNLITLKRLLK